jgi:hypothetical protein
MRNGLRTANETCDLLLGWKFVFVICPSEAFPSGWSLCVVIGHGSLTNGFEGGAGLGTCPGTKIASSPLNIVVCGVSTAAEY